MAQAQIPPVPPPATGRSRRGWLVGALVGVAALVAATVWIVWATTSGDEGDSQQEARQQADEASTSDDDASLAQDRADAASPADATWLLIQPTDPGLAGELVAATTAILDQRLAGTDAQVEVEGVGLRITFTEPPAPEVVAHLTDPVEVTFRPVLAVSGPEAFPPGDGAERAVDEPESHGDASSYLTGDMVTAFAELDCTRAGTPPVVSAAGAMAACDASGTSKYALGPVEMTGDAVSDVEAAPTTDGGTASRAVLIVTFGPEGTAALRDVTSRLANLPAPANMLAIVVDGRVISAPAVHEVITAGILQFSGAETDEVYALAAHLQFGRPGMTWQVVPSSG